MNNIFFNEFNEFNKRQLKNDLPIFKSGDIVNVSIKITENNKIRIQNFQGIVMQRKGSNLNINSTFTVRKISANNIGVEKTFLLHSPNIKIDVLKKGKVRRNKISYIRKNNKK